MSTHRFLRRVNTGSYAHDEFEVVTNTEVDGPDAKQLAISHVRDMMKLAYQGEKECDIGKSLPVNQDHPVSLTPPLSVAFPTPTNGVVAAVENAAAFTPPDFGSVPQPASPVPTSIAPPTAVISTDITDEMMMQHGRQHAARIDMARPGHGIVDVNRVTLKYVCRPLGATTIGITAPDGTAVPPDQKNVLRRQWMDEIAALQ